MTIHSLPLFMLTSENSRTRKLIIKSAPAGRGGCFCSGLSGTGQSDSGLCQASSHCLRISVKKKKTKKNWVFQVYNLRQVGRQGWTYCTGQVYVNLTPATITREEGSLTEKIPPQDRGVDKPV